MNQYHIKSGDTLVNNGSSFQFFLKMYIHEKKLPK